MWDDTDMLGDNGAGFAKLDEEAAGPSGSNAAARREPRNLMSVNIDILNNFYNAEKGLVIYGQAVSSIAILGHVEDVIEMTTMLSFKIRDDCGPPIEINFLGTREGKDAETVGFAETSLVKVFGKCRYKEGRVYISAFKVDEVKDLNEIAVHKLEVIYHSKMLEKLKQNPILTDISEVLGNSEATGLSVDHQNLMNTIASANTFKGISYNQILSCNHSMDKRQVRKNLDFLLREGLVYSTIDDNHFKLTNI